MDGILNANVTLGRSVEEIGEAHINLQFIEGVGYKPVSHCERNMRGAS